MLNAALRGTLSPSGDSHALGWSHVQSLSFKKVLHGVKNIDAQPSGCGGIIVHVVGELKVLSAVCCLLSCIPTRLY